MNKSKLFFLISVACFLYFLSSATPAFATQFISSPSYGHYNLWLLPDNVCSASGAVGVSIQASQQYAEFDATNTQGWYSYQLNIATPTTYPGPGGSTIAFQQTAGIENQFLYNTGVSFFGAPNSPPGIDAIPPVPQNTINPSLSSTAIDLTQTLNAQGQVTQFNFNFYYSGGSYSGYVPVTTGYLATENEYQISIDGNPRTDGYDFFTQGSGTFIYTFPSGSIEGVGTDAPNPPCEYFGTAESSTMTYGVAACGTSTCTQPFSYGAIETTLSSSTYSPQLGQTPTLTVAINFEVINSASSTIELLDESTDQVVGMCPAYNGQTSCAVENQEFGSPRSQEYIGELVGPSGFIISTSSPIVVTWGNPPPSLTITSENQYGQTITGYYTELDQNGVKIGSGFTPYTFNNLVSGDQYTVFVDNYGNCVFSQWSDGTTNRQKTFTMTSSSMALTAYYNCGSTSGSLTVDTVNQNDQPINGYYVGIYDTSHNPLYNGYSPVTFNQLTVGTNYYVEPDSYQSCTFNHWQDTGSTVRDRLFTAQSSETLTAVYQCT